ncbi:MAG TPA: WYL domain-containing protein [Kofleriaceae bacterium]|nr:WYL domain-containing protein [Kofleriaceae bacterium]
MYRRGDLNHISRALRVLDELRGFRRGRRLADIAKQLDASERTIRRDLGDLRTAGFEIESVTIDGRAGARLVERTYSNIAITRRERYTLLAIASLFDVLRGTPLWEDVSSLQRKLEQRMSPEERAEHASLGDRFAYVPDNGTKAYEGKEDILDALLTGVLSRRVVRYAYRDARGRARQGFFAPYTMLLYKHGLYVVGRRLREPSDGRTLATDAASEPAIAVLAVERFTEAEHLRSAPFTVPAGFRIGEILNGAFGIHVTTGAAPHRVVIEFSAEKAAFVRARVWHPTQTFEELADRRIRLTFQCANLTPVVSWVLEWGPHARAIEPPALVADIVAELDAARRAYA